MMMSRYCALLPLAGLVACAPDPAPGDPSGGRDASTAENEAPAAAGQSPVAGGPDHAGYRAGGNEPFWTLTFGETTMDFFDLGRGDTVRATRPDAEVVADGWRFTATPNGAPYLVEVRDRRCSDSMSGRPFPHTVTVTVNDRTYSGCGGDTGSLLTGEEWRVTHLEGTETTGRQSPTLLFASGGVLTGHGGCNRFRGTYEITGEGISIGPALATRMACADPEANAQETRFFALLEQVTRFDFAEDGSLELLAMDRPIIVAQR